MKIINVLFVSLILTTTGCQSIQESSIDPAKITQKNWTGSGHLLIIENQSLHFFDIMIDGVLIRSDLPPGKLAHKVLNFGQPAILKLTAIPHVSSEEEINVTVLQKFINFPEASIPFQGLVAKFEVTETSIEIKK